VSVINLAHGWTTVMQENERNAKPTVMGPGHQ
jgi:hypothetical protein